MSTRTRGPRTFEDAPPAEDHALDGDDLFAYETSYGLDDDITDDDIADFLREKEAEDTKPGFWNLPTVAGLSTIGVGSAYLLQELGFSPLAVDFSALVGPWLIGVLIILIGFGVLSWSPNRARRMQRRREKAERRRVRREARKANSRSGRRERKREDRRERKAERRERYARRKSRFAKSRTNRKIAGVCGGIGEALSIDPTLVRIAFVIASIASFPMPLFVYLGLAWFMPTADTPKRAGDIKDDHVIVIR